MNEKKPQNNNLLYRYAGLAFQLMASLAIGVYGGYWLDKWIKPGIPVFIWVLPLLILIGILVRIVKDTSEK